MIRRTLSRVPVYVLWALASIFLWGFVFSFLTDTTPAKKLSVYISAENVDGTELAARLEDSGLPDGIRMVKARSFSYAAFSDGDLQTADLYVVKASEAAEWRDSFLPLPDGLAGDLNLGDSVCGIRVYDAESGTGLFDDLIGYAVPGVPAEDYYLFFGAGSQHTGSGDGGALWLAQRFLEGSH